MAENIEETKIHPEYLLFKAEVLNLGKGRDTVYCLSDKELKNICDKMINTLFFTNPYKNENIKDAKGIVVSARFDTEKKSICYYSCK